jgi:hypothetical protein
MRSACMLVVCALVLGACDGNNVPTVDGGTQTDAGGNGGAVDGGMDGGPRPECSLSEQDCPSGSSCMEVASDGGQPAPRCVAGACGIVAQDCQGGQKCTYTVDGGTSSRQCVQPTGSATEGQSCTVEPSGLDTCQAGLICLKVTQEGGTSVNQCLRFCHADTHCADTQICNLQLVLPGLEELPRLCATRPQSCDALAQNCSNTAEACYPTNSGDLCLTPGSVAVGGACQSANDCVAGSTCVPDDAQELRCRSLCRYPPDGGSPVCTEGSCRQLASSSAGACVP